MRINIDMPLYYTLGDRKRFKSCMGSGIQTGFRWIKTRLNFTCKIRISEELIKIISLTGPKENGYKLEKGKGEKERRNGEEKEELTNSPVHITLGLEKDFQPKKLYIKKNGLTYNYLC